MSHQELGEGITQVVLDFHGVEIASAAFIGEVFLRLKLAEIPGDSVSVINVSDRATSMRIDAELVASLRSAKLFGVVQH